MLPPFPERNPLKWWTLFGASLVLLMVNLDTTITNLALAPINHYFHQSLSALQWVINAYVATAAVGFIFFGRLAKHVSMKFLFLLGVFSFAIGSLICGVSDYFSILIIGRIIQGIGFAISLNLAILLAQFAFPQKQQGLAVGCSAIMTGMGLALGPAIGALIIHLWGWRWIFGINIPIALITFIICGFTVRHAQTRQSNQRIDYLSVALLVTAIFSFIIFTTLVKHNGLMQYQPLTYLLICIISIVWLIIWSKKTAHSLILPVLFTNKGFVNVLIVRGMLMAVWGSLFYCLPLYMQNIMLLPTLNTGLLLISLAVLFGFFSPIMGNLMDRHGSGRLMTTASFIGILSLVLLILYFEFNLTAIWIAIPLFGFGYVMSVLAIGTIHQAHYILPKSQVASAMGLFFCLGFIALTISVTIDTMLLTFLPKLIVSGQFITTILPAELHYLLSHISISQPLKHIEAIHLVRISFRYTLQSILLINVIFLFIAAFFSHRCTHDKPTS